MESTKGRQPINQVSSCCGVRFEPNAYPRACSCGNTFYDNPTPVVVVIVRIKRRNQKPGYLAIRRSPKMKVAGGRIAFPGGFLEIENAIAATLRELNEEDGGVKLDPDQVHPFYWASIQNNREVLLFAYTDEIDEDQLGPFNPQLSGPGGGESTERHIITTHEEIFWPLHQEALKALQVFERVLALSVF